MHNCWAVGKAPCSKFSSFSLTAITTNDCPLVPWSPNPEFYHHNKLLLLFLGHTSCLPCQRLKDIMQTEGMSKQCRYLWCTCFGDGEWDIAVIWCSFNYCPFLGKTVMVMPLLIAVSWLILLYEDRYLCQHWEYNDSTISLGSVMTIEKKRKKAWTRYK